MRPRSIYTVLNILWLAMTTFAKCRRRLFHLENFRGKDVYHILACLKVFRQAFKTISPSQMYSMGYSTDNNQCATSFEQFAQIPAASLVYKPTPSEGLVYYCSKEFNGNVLKSISKIQLGSINAATFGNIPVATFKNIPAEAFAALTKSQMYSMDYSTDNNQCAALSAEQFAQIPAASLVYKSSQSKSGLVYSCSSQLNGNANDALTLMSGISSNPYITSFGNLQAKLLEILNLKDF